MSSTKMSNNIMTRYYGVTLDQDEIDMGYFLIEVATIIKLFEEHKQWLDRKLLEELKNELVIMLGIHIYDIQIPGIICYFTLEKLRKNPTEKILIFIVARLIKFGVKIESENDHAIRHAMEYERFELLEYLMTEVMENNILD